MNADRRTIVVGVDDSKEARSALRWAAEQARLRSAPLKVVHAFQARHLAGVFRIAKLQPDSVWRADARRWLTMLSARRSVTISLISSLSRTPRRMGRPQRYSPRPPTRRCSSSGRAGVGLPVQRSTVR
jgi:hypothetical protein